MGKRILVIDDEPGIRQILEIHLVSAGYEVVSAGDLLSGLEHIGRGGVDLAVCDFKLPDMEGVGIVHAIKGLRRELPLVIISGFIDDEMEEKASAYGVIEYLKKPFS